MYINAFDLGRETARHVKEFYSLSQQDKTNFLRGLKAEAGGDGICESQFLHQLGGQLATLYGIKSLDAQASGQPISNFTNVPTTAASRFDTPATIPGC